MRTCTFGLAALAAVAIGSTAAGAAVRVCEAPLAKVAKAATESEARKQALAGWRDGARTKGEGYTRWELADHRQVVCTKVEAGGFQCLALARPCIIQQAPPPKSAPGKGGPTKPGMAI